MRFISSAFYFFTPYTDAREQAVERFFRRVTERSNQSQTRTRLSDLLQRNIAVINLWTEYRYKGYRYLRKSERKRMYANLKLITDDFDRFCVSNMPSADTAVSHVHEVAPHAVVDPIKVARLQALMNYFSPERGVYKYRDSSSFGRLLRNPSHEKLVGDCNQIVTLYIYLYSRYHDVHDLQIRILPGHVALHYSGIDIEATNGTFATHDEQKSDTLLPVEEIVSMNLLDTTDSYLPTHEVNPKYFLQASRFAFILSHDRNIVTYNLHIAYGKLISVLLERNNYAQALKFAVASRDREYLDIVGHDGAVYEIGRNNYAAARRFAQHALDHDELVRSSWRSEGISHYQAHHYRDAIKAFEHIGDQALVRQCYEGMFFEEQKRLGPDLTTDSIQKYAGTVKRMHVYAKKSGNKSLIKYADNLKKHL